MRDPDGAVDENLALHRSSGGATFNLYDGDMAGRKLFAVAAYPERTVSIPGAVLPAGLLRAFIHNCRDLLEDPRNCLGTWFSQQRDIIVLDVSIMVESLEQAIELGRQYNQDAIFDLERMTAIDI